MFEDIYEELKELFDEADSENSNWIENTSDKLNEIKYLWPEKNITDIANDLSDFEVRSQKQNGGELRVGGIISASKVLFDKRNNQWAIVTLDGMKSKAEIFVFSDLYNLKKDLLEENSMVFIVGKLSNRQSEDDDVLKIIADDIIEISRVRNKLSKHIHVKIDYSQNNPEILSKIKELVTANRGNCRFIVNIEASTGYIQKMVSKDINVNPGIDFIKKLREILGEKNVWIET